ncbi:dihydrodipicolinate synthase family protein [Canibacter zhoujuaniae]|uniref:dihydrodipicolinate synthase family protein n=1 Tax=Canibacter zhoujuaniae TaxID=2708343 RepID=UPI001420BFF1|nr:dihydrodipicolinate synthase family protein [Canibacter zhoujuaniae]
MTQEQLFSGLSAFPLTPFVDDTLDEQAYAGLIKHLRDARYVDAGGTEHRVASIGALGSTGSYTYLSPAEYRQGAEIAVANAGEVPVFLGVSALRTTHMLDRLRTAHEVGASAVLLSPLHYQPLRDHEVFDYYRTAAENSDLPIIIYDNPGTTNFNFSLELYTRLTALPQIKAVKIPGLRADTTGCGSAADADHLNTIREAVGSDTAIGISGDYHATSALRHGSELFFSVFGGTLPTLALELVAAAADADPQASIAVEEKLQQLWDLYRKFGGSLRVMDAAAGALGLVQSSAAASSFPLPVQGLDAAARAEIAAVITHLLNN